MNSIELEQVEVGVLLEAIYRRYGYDFRWYAQASISRRVRQFMSMHRLATVSELIPRILHDPDFFSEMAQSFSVNVTEMFRDPPFYLALRQKVLPMLQTYPFVRIWHAGCATGEEVYSMAILLHEEGMYGRTTLYGTDFNDQALDKARQGVYAPEQVQAYTRNYQEAGGKSSFSDYYLSQYNSAALNAWLRERIVFANHNLASDAVFGEMHVVCCRNVLIYFNEDLQNKVLQLFTDSLIRGGYLCLGTKEDIRFTTVAGQYEVVDQKARIFRKKVR